MSSFTENNNQIPELQENLQLLQEQPFFSSFPARAKKLLAYLAERGQYAKDEIIIEQGEDYGRAYLVLSGRLTLTKGKEDAAEVIRHYEGGALLGSFSLLGSMPSLFQLRATAPSVALIITREHFTKIVEQFPQISTLALKAFLEELYQWERKNLTKAEKCCSLRSGATIL